MVTPTNPYAQAVVDVHDLSGVRLENSTLADLGGSVSYLSEALKAVGEPEGPDEPSAALSALADRLQAECAADRNAVDWADKAVAMGWIRTAAAEMWRVDSALRMSRPR